MSYQENRVWSDQFMPQIKQILGLYLIGEASEIEDCKHNTDLIVLSMAAVRIGCRVRRSGYAEKYGDEFTIRASVPSGHKTELAKVIEGWGDYFFYGHAGDDGLALWALCDLKVFRLWFMRQLAKRKGDIPGVLQKNGDGSSEFRAFKFCDLPSEFIVARKSRA